MKTVGKRMQQSLSDRIFYIIATVIAVGFSTGSTILKNVWIGVQPSIIAASSREIGIALIKPANMNTDSPAPNPTYTKIIPTGFPRFNVSVTLDSVNITIWNGTIIANTNR